MHDLNTIGRLNAQAHAKGIQSLTDQGRYVVATYSGLHLVSFASFADSDAAIDAAHALPGSPDEHFKVFVPTADALAVATRRDQSEDRAPLAGYIDSVLRSENLR